MGTKTMFRII